ncbi:SIS domain-containing protein [Bacillus megaterium NBRC 15308 = ATCC 14581]|nr:SIS domain-containing protein [Priestia megaterium NBRC 15308 = ATCC 14581]
MHRHDMIHELEYLQKMMSFFLISLTGETSQVLEIACLGHEKQIPIVSMTNFTRNPLQQIAEYNLYCYAPQKVIHGYNATDRTPLMIVLRKLSECFGIMSNVYLYTKNLLYFRMCKNKKKISSYFFVLR